MISYIEIEVFHCRTNAYAENIKIKNSGMRSVC